MAGHKGQQNFHSMNGCLDVFLSNLACCASFGMIHHGYELHVAALLDQSADACMLLAVCMIHRLLFHMQNFRK